MSRLRPIATPMKEAQRLLDEVRHQLDKMVEARLLCGWGNNEHRRYGELVALEALLLGDIEADGGRFGRSPLIANSAS